MIQALYDAADDDSATGGPDLTRRIFPVVHVITPDGGRRLPDGKSGDRRPDPRRPHAAPRRPGRGPPDLREFRHMSMPFYVSPEQLMKDRADFARKGIARGRCVVALQYADGILFVSENPLAGAAQGQRDLRPDRVRGGRSLQRVREPPDRGRTARRHARLRLRPARRHRSRARQRLRPDPRHDLLHGWREALRGRDLRRRGGRRARGRPAVPAHLRRPGRRRARICRDGWRGRDGRHPPDRALRRGRDPGGTLRVAVAALGHGEPRTA